MRSVGQVSRIASFVRGRGVLGIVTLSTLVACGGDGSSSTAAVATFVPADRSVRVDIRPTIRVAFDTALDAGAAIATHVTLSQAGFNVPATITYDGGAHVVAIVPSRALQHDTRYTVAISGLVDASGHAVPDASATFATWINAEVEFDYPDGGASVGETLPTTRVVTTLDADGHPYRSVATDTFGDALLCQQFFYVDGTLATTTDYDPGADQQCFTADDSAFQRYEYDHDPGGRLASIDEFSFDTLVAVETFEDDANGNVILDSTIVVGLDGVPGTADDVYVDAIASTYDATGRLLRSVVSSGAPGDAPYSETVVVPGTAGAPDRTTDYIGPGPDGAWGTADDIVLSYQDDSLDARGNVVMTQEYLRLPDGSDVPIDAILNTYDAHDNLVTRETRWPDAAGAVQMTRHYDTAH